MDKEREDEMFEKVIRTSKDVHYLKQTIEALPCKEHATILSELHDDKIRRNGVLIAAEDFEKKVKEAETAANLARGQSRKTFIGMMAIIISLLGLVVTLIVTNGGG